MVEGVINPHRGITPVDQSPFSGDICKWMFSSLPVSLTERCQEVFWLGSQKKKNVALCVYFDCTILDNVENLTFTWCSP